MPPNIITPAAIAQMYSDFAPYIKGVKDWAPVELFDTNTLGAAVIPQTQFFNAARGRGVCNLETQNKVPNYTIVFALSVDFFCTGAAAIADAIIIRDECEIEIEIDDKKIPSIPLCCINSGSGLNSAVSQTNAGAGGRQAVSNGVSNAMFTFRQPFAIDPKQSFRGWLQSVGATALTTATPFRLTLKGIEARRPA